MREEKLKELESFAERFESVVNSIKSERLKEKIREGGWSFAQIIHHIADAQSQAYYRVKWILTEDETVLKTFLQDKWAELPDSITNDVSGSVALIKGVYIRWSQLMQSLTEQDWNKRGKHPESGDVTVASLFEFYSNHGEGHLKALTDKILRS